MQLHNRLSLVIQILESEPFLTAATDGIFDIHGRARHCRNTSSTTRLANDVACYHQACFEWSRSCGRDQNKRPSPPASAPSVPTRQVCRRPPPAACHRRSRRGRAPPHSPRVAAPRVRATSAPTKKVVVDTSARRARSPPQPAAARPTAHDACRPPPATRAVARRPVPATMWCPTSRRPRAARPPMTWSLAVAAAANSRTMNNSPLSTIEAAR